MQAPAAVNILSLTPLDRMSDGIASKLIAMTPIVSNIVMFVKHVRFNHVMKSDKYSEPFKLATAINMNRFTVTVCNLGKVQLISSLALGLIGIFAAGVFLPAIALPVGVALIFTVAALQIHHQYVNIKVGTKHNELMKKFMIKVPPEYSR